MKIIKILLSVVIVLFIEACSSSKKSTTSVSTVSTTTTTNTKEDLFSFTKLSNATIPPRNEELIAIQARHKDVTMDKLKEGHSLYTGSACRGCHGIVNIYKHDESTWRNIIDDMAKRAQLSDSQKDAVYKYVLAIKATQPKIE
jgi:hypothetical protein